MKRMHLGGRHDMDPRPRRARDLFTSGHLCSQAVLAAFCSEFGLDEETALRLACGFGSGIARRQDICGAVSGAIMVAGLKHGRVHPEDREAVELTYGVTREIIRGFTDQHGTINCRELLDCDISNPEARKQAEERGLFATKCAQFVEDAARLALKACEGG